MTKEQKRIVDIVFLLKQMPRNFPYVFLFYFANNTQKKRFNIFKSKKGRVWFKQHVLECFHFQGTTLKSFRAHHRHIT